MVLEYPSQLMYYSFQKIANGEMKEMKEVKGVKEDLYHFLTIAKVV